MILGFWSVMNHIGICPSLNCWKRVMNWDFTEACTSCICACCEATWDSRDSSRKAISLFSFSISSKSLLSSAALLLNSSFSLSSCARIRCPAVHVVGFGPAPRPRIYADRSGPSTASNLSSSVMGGMPSSNGWDSRFLSLSYIQQPIFIINQSSDIYNIKNWNGNKEWNNKLHRLPGNSNPPKCLSSR